MDKLGDLCNYVVFDNPISKTMVSVTKAAVKPLVGSLDTKPQIQIVHEPLPLFELAATSGPFVRIAAVSGATAVALGAYGAHKKYPKDKVDELKPIYETGNRMHFFHTLALLGVPLCKYQKASATFIIAGTILFSGPCYYYAFTGENKYGRLAPIGGTLLILGWLSMAL